MLKPAFDLMMIHYNSHANEENTNHLPQNKEGKPTGYSPRFRILSLPSMV